MNHRSKLPSISTLDRIRSLEPIVNSPSPQVSVVIHAKDDRNTIADVIQQAAGVHPETEVIVVADGALDGTSEIAERLGARVMRSVYPLGAGVGRRAGASMARGGILLFTEGDIVLSARQLAPFIDAVENGTDIALNQYTGAVNKMIVRTSVLSRYAVNLLLDRQDLLGASMVSIPFAVSRQALHTLGVEIMAEPIKAQIAAIMKGLRLKAVHRVDLGKSGLGQNGRQRSEPGKEQSLRDHLAAIQWFIEQTGPRFQGQDLDRRLGG